MQLKVSMQKNIGERGSTRPIYVHSLLILHDSDKCAARLVVVHDLVGTCPRFGVATHGLVAHELNFMDMTEPCR